MSSRAAALVAIVAGIALVLAQDVVPGWVGFHTWQYAAVLTIVALVILSYANTVRKGKDGEVGRRLSIALIGALIVLFAGLASGLLGPDTQTIASAPGTVVPLPDVNAAAFFPNVNAQQFAADATALQLRRRNGSVLELPQGGRRYFGTLVLESQPHPAAYVEARDSSGAHLTITQPTNASFLSPVLLFPQTFSIVGRRLPADAFAVPALHRQVKVFYISKADSDIARARGLEGQQLLLFSVTDDAEHELPGAIGFGENGKDVQLGGVQLRSEIGMYPALVISSVPAPLALWLGGLAVIGGFLYAFAWRGRPPSLAAKAALLL